MEKQKTKDNCLSTCKAEYMALAEATQEALFLMQLVKDMTHPYSCDTFTLYCDNQSAISLTKNAMVHQRSKHIDIKYHFVWLIISNDTMEFIYFPSEKNIANVFTKQVGGNRLKNFIKILMGA